MEEQINLQNLEEIRENAYSKVLTIMNLIHTGMDPTLFRSLDSIQYRIKSEHSILMKQKKVGNNLYDVYDLIGIRYIFTDLSEVDQIKKAILCHSDFDVKEVKNSLYLIL